MTYGHIPLYSKMIPRLNLFIENENETQAANYSQVKMNVNQLQLNSWNANIKTFRGCFRH